MKFKPNPEYRLMDQVSEVLRYYHYAYRTEQALNALIFLYEKVLDVDLGDVIAPTRSKRRMNLPTVLTQKEVSRLLGKMKGKHALMTKLLYGGGLRLLECVRLRVKDVDFGQGKILYVPPKAAKTAQ